MAPCTVDDALCTVTRPSGLCLALVVLNTFIKDMSMFAGARKLSSAADTRTVRDPIRGALGVLRT